MLFETNDKMKLIIFGILTVILSLCSADDLICELFGGDLSSAKYYCVNFVGEIPEECSKNTSNTIFKSRSTPLSIVKWLKIGGCESNAVMDTIRRFENVRDLDISFSEHLSLEWFNVKLNELILFNASHNELTGTPFDLFNEMPRLTEVDLSFNRIKVILTDTFKGSALLTKINLSHNEISSIKYQPFETLKHLTFVDLSSNLLSEINGIFNSNKNLSVNLRHTPISRFDCSKIHGFFVQMTFDSLVDFVTDCNDFEFQVIQNSDKKGLFGVSPGKYEIHCNEQSFSKLKSFEGSANSSENLGELIGLLGPSLETLKISDYHIRELLGTLLNKFSDLRSLTLANASITEFNFAWINSRRLHSFHISGSHLKKLKKIDLLKRIDPHTVKMIGTGLNNVNELIDGLTSWVETLDLSGNFVGRLNASTFDKLERLKWLRLDSTNLSFGDSNPFEKLYLYELDISHNNLTNLNFGLLQKTLGQLKGFSAVNCSIKNISDVIQYLGSNITELNLSGNNIGHAIGEIFTIGPHTFDKLTRMQKLSVADNHLSEFDIESLSVDLRYLNIAGNELKDVGNLSPRIFFKMTEISIAENRFSCRYLAAFVKDWSEHSTEGIQFIGDTWNQKHNKTCHPIN